MKKCQGCHQEIDKYAIACQYCGKLAEQSEPADDSTKKDKDAEETKESDGGS